MNINYIYERESEWVSERGREGGRGNVQFGYLNHRNSSKDTHTHTHTQILPVFSKSDSDT